MTFTYEVKIDDVDIAGMTLTGGTIQYGATSSGETPVPSTAFLELISADAAGDLVSDYPGVSWRGGVTSGFVDVYSDTYEGASSILPVGVPLTVDVQTVSGFTDIYYDEYFAGNDSRRFTGTIAAIDYTPGVIGITGVDLSERLARSLLSPSNYPPEAETARVQRIAEAAGVKLTIVGTSTVTVIGTGDNEAEDDAYSLITRLADLTGAVFYVDRYGVPTYRCADAAPGDTYTVDPGATLLDPLAMTQELGTIVNTITVEYGVEDELTGERPTLTSVVATSVGTYGSRPPTSGVQTVDLATRQDAQAYADRVLAAYAFPRWHMPNATAHLGLAQTDGMIDDLLTADLDDILELPQLLPASPEASYASRLIGYVEVLDPEAWQLTFVLDPHGWSREGIAI